MLPPPNEDNRIADLLRRVENLESALRAAFTTISGGAGLTIKDGGGLTINGGTLRVLYPDSEGGGLGVYFGDTYADIDGQYSGTGLLIQDADESDIAVFRSDAATGNPIAVIRDGQQNAVFYTDPAGEGLGRPYVPGVFYPSRNTDWISTSSGTFETLFRAKMPKQHAKLLARVWTDHGTVGATGQVQVLVNNAVLGSVASTASGFITEKQFYGAVAGAHMADLSVEIQARVVSGGGVLRIWPSSLDGRP